jgi:hypothetical protein
MVCAVYVKTMFKICKLDSRYVTVCNFNGICGAEYLSWRIYIYELNMQEVQLKTEPRCTANFLA